MNIIDKVKQYYHAALAISKGITKVADIQLYNLIKERQRNHPNPFVQYGSMCYSQTDEDGLTLEIVNRLRLKNGIFAEFGVGNGLENNTLFLLTIGWRGFWVGGEKLAFDASHSNKLFYERAWINRGNILQLWLNGLSKFRTEQVDLISLDLDGNDYYFCEELLNNGARPKVFVVEYNAKFIPPSEFIITYAEGHKWMKDDYFGASLQSIVNLFERFDYFLVCCNAATGANAFFVQKKYRQHFPEVPDDVSKLYVEPFYHLPDRFGHKVSARTVERIISE
jgi:hypothetical protein